MSWWDNSVLKESTMQGLVATGSVAISLSLVDQSALSGALLLSVFAVTT